MYYLIYHLPKIRQFHNIIITFPYNRYYIVYIFPPFIFFPLTRIRASRVGILYILAIIAVVRLCNDII